MTTAHVRKRRRPSRLNQEPSAITWAREKCGLTKRALARSIGISEQLMNEIESGWRSATPANLIKIAKVLKCPVVIFERRQGADTAEQEARMPDRNGSGEGVEEALVHLQDLLACWLYVGTDIESTAANCGHFLQAVISIIDGLLDPDYRNWP